MSEQAGRSRSHGRLLANKWAPASHVQSRMVPYQIGSCGLAPTMCQRPKVCVLERMRHCLLFPLLLQTQMLALTGEAGAKPAASSQKRQHLLKHGSGGTDLDPDDSFRIESSPGAEHGEHTLSPTLSPSTSDAADSQLSSRPGSGEHNQAGDSPPVSPHSRAAAHSNGGDGVLSSVPSSAHGEVHLDTAITHHFHGTSLK